MNGILIGSLIPDRSGGGSPWSHTMQGMRISSMHPPQATICAAFTPSAPNSIAGCVAVSTVAYSTL